MNMIGNAADFDRMTVLWPYNSANILIKPRPNVISDCWATILGPEDNVISEFRKCTHVLAVSVATPWLINIFALRIPRVYGPVAQLAF